MKKINSDARASSKKRDEFSIGLWGLVDKYELSEAELHEVFLRIMTRDNAQKLPKLCK